MIKSYSRLYFHPPNSQIYRNIDKEKLNKLKEILISEYFTHLNYSEGVIAESYLSSEEGKLDLHMHLLGRLEGFRRSVILWIWSIKDLKCSKILEIGCGTGSSTLALARTVRKCDRSRHR